MNTFNLRSNALKGLRKAMNDFEITGFDELQEDLKKAINYYPDKAKETLEKEGRRFKAEVKKVALSSTKKHNGNLTKGFRVSKAQGFRENMEVNFMAENKKNPHWHLIENGHDVYAGGKNGNESKKVGYIAGKHIVERVTVKYRAEFPKRLETMRDEILKEAGF